MWSCVPSHLLSEAALKDSLLFFVTEERYSEWSEEVQVAQGHILNVFCSKASQSKSMVQN